MPSVLLTGASGAPFPLVSGNYWSGTGAFHPVGGVLLVLDRVASGSAYISFSGGATLNSGTHLFSGTNADGVQLIPGAERFIPKLCLISGQMNIFVTCDAAASGNRLYWEVL